MATILTAEELEKSFFVDPTRSWAWGICPDCGGHIVLGHRKDNGNLTLAHSAIPDPLHPGTAFCGCESFRELAPVQGHEYLRTLRGKGFRFQKVGP
jgi:hypothetical protein